MKAVGQADELKVKFTEKLFETVKVASVFLLLTALLVFIADVLLLVFAGLLLSLFLISLSQWISKTARLTYGWSLGILCVLLLFAVGVAGWLMAPSIAEQFDELTTKVPQSIEKIKGQIRDYSWAQPILNEVEPEKVLGSGRRVWSRATGAISGFLGGIASAVIVLFLGLYGAAEPETYKRGLIFLFPKSRRNRVGEVFDEIGDTLRWWLIGKFISMAVVGVLTALGLWLLDVPLAFVLALIASVLTFIPNIGPLLSAVPAVLLGLTEGPEQALYIALLYIGIQSIESYLITPLIQRKTVNLPPGLTLSTQVILGVIFGGLGVALATPLTAAALVGTKRFYVEDTLGDSL